MTATIDDYSPRIGRKAVRPVWSADGGVVYGRDAERRAVGELFTKLGITSRNQLQWALSARREPVPVWAVTTAS